jgi:Transposase IS66 family
MQPSWCITPSPSLPRSLFALQPLLELPVIHGCTAQFCFQGLIRQQRQQCSPAGRQLGKSFVKRRVGSLDVAAPHESPDFHETTAHRVFATQYKVRLIGLQLGVANCARRLPEVKRNRGASRRRGEERNRSSSFAVAICRVAKIHDAGPADDGRLGLWLSCWRGMPARRGRRTVFGIVGRSPRLSPKTTSPALLRSLFLNQLAARQEQSVPILDRLGLFLREQRDGALPKSQYGKAIAYARNHWPELCRFTESGVLEIDNNIAERTLRLCAVGRKNWLFVGSDRDVNRLMRNSLEVRKSSAMPGILWKQFRLRRFRSLSRWAS